MIVESECTTNSDESSFSKYKDEGFTGKLKKVVTKMFNVSYKEIFILCPRENKRLFIQRGKKYRV